MAATQSEFCPAKVNLMLCVTGQRPDGYHDLVSIMVPLDFGDVLIFEPRRGGGRTFTCSDADLLMDEANLVVRAARLFEESHPIADGYRLHLNKRIPCGAGLGGGSSDAAGTLRLLNRVAGEPCTGAQMRAMAATLGSDCPFFLENRVSIVRGRGDRLERLSSQAARRLAGVDLLLVKPSFPVPTAFAYRRMVERKGDYISSGAAEERLERWIHSGQPLQEVMFNNMEPAVFEKYVALPVLKERLRRLGANVLMSGSGSTLILVAAVGDDGIFKNVAEAARDAWGESAWVRRVKTK